MLGQPYMFQTSIYDRGEHLGSERFVAIVKHKYGHFFEDKNELSAPHLHVYKVDLTFVIRDGVHATQFDHYFWKNYTDENESKNYKSLIRNL